eukprot:g24573.t1
MRCGGFPSDDYPDTDEEACFPKTTYNLPPRPCDNTELLSTYLKHGSNVPGGTVQFASAPALSIKLEDLTSRVSGGSNDNELIASIVDEELKDTNP